MIRLRCAPGIALALAWSVAAPCFANDTSASLNAGGLVFEKSAAVQMKSEVLSISPETIEVDYVFANAGPQDVTTTVAFPLPELNLAEMTHSPVSIPSPGKQNFLNFKTWVNGKEIALKNDVHAVLEDGRDIAGEMQRLGVNIFTEKQKYMPELQGKLLKLGALVDGGYGDIFPVWVAKTSYYWTQTFPAGKELRIEHRYSPGPYESLVREAEAEWCTDEGYKAVFSKLPKREGGYLPAKAVRYVLRTGANWAGPIGDFTLKLGKGKAAFLSTCPIEGLTLERKGSAFVARAKDFTPKADLNILFVFARNK